MSYFTRRKGPQWHKNLSYVNMKIIYTAFLCLIILQTGESQIVYTPNVYGFLGDYGSDDPNEAAVANLIKSWNPDAIMTLGDNNYPDGNAADIDKNIGKYFHDYIKPYTGTYGPGADKNRFWPAIGNHDLMTADGAPYLAYFQLPDNERYYDFVIGEVHFICMNTNSSEPDGVSPTSVQGTWLKNKLQSSTSKWKIVYGHHSPYSSDDLYGNHSFMQWPFREWGADILITAHSHTYERLVIDNFTYVVCGLGGRSVYNFDSPKPGSIKRYNSKYGALQLKVTSDALLFTFFAVDNEAVDNFSVTKTPMNLTYSQQECMVTSIYPNPTKGDLYLNHHSCKSEDETDTVIVTDIFGDTVQSEYVPAASQDSQKRIQLSEKLRAGVYFLEVKSQNGNYRAKIILDR